MIRKFKARGCLLTSVAFACIATGTAANAQQAQEAPKDEAETEQIIVTGARLQNKRAIEDKRDSIRIIDAVASDEIGSLPDDNAGEALQRIPGISIQTDQAEARFASVRGLNPNYNFTTIDGNIIASPDRGGRQIFLDVLPSSLAKTIEVVKSFTPDIDGEAIGGHINFISRSAFDYKRDFSLKAYGRIGLYENHTGPSGSSPSGKADIVITKKFGANRDWGVLLAADYYLRDSYIPQIENGSRYRYYDPVTRAQVPFDTTADGRVPRGGRLLEDLAPVPDERRWFQYHNSRQRYGASVKLDHKPNDDFSASLKGYYHTARDSEERYASIASSPSPTLISSQTSGIVRANHRFELGQFDFERTLWGGQAIIENRFAGGEKLDLNVTYSGTYFNNPEYFTEFRRDGLLFEYDTSGRIQTWNPVDPAAYFDYDRYRNNRKNELNFRSLREDIFEARIDFGRNWDGKENDGFGYRLGGKARYRTREFDQGRDLWTPAVNTIGDPNDVNLSQFIGAVVNEVPGATSVATPDTFRVINAAAFNEFFFATRDNRAIWRFDDQLAVDEQSDYTFDEWSFAGYGMASYRAPNWYLVAGARLETIEFKATGRGQVNGGAFQLTRNDNNYTRLLPSVNAFYDVSPSVRVRAAYSRSLGRPRFDDLAPRGETIDLRPTIPVVSRANPDLRPRQSDNFDLSAAWYFDGGEGIFSVGLFHKNIKDEFFTVRTTQQLDIGNGPQEVRVTQPINLANPVKIWGLEANFVKNLDFLPEPFDGLGVSLNGTLLDGDWLIPNSTTSSTLDLDGDGLIDVAPYRTARTLEDSANVAFNASLFYEKGPLAARLAWNRIGLQLDSVAVGEPERDNYLLPRDKVDFQISYKFSKQFKAGFEVQNLTNSGRRENIGLNQELVQTGIADFGRAAFISITFTK